jgi:antitoxin VapB
MIKTTVFKSNQTQAVRLPKAVAFPEGVKTVEIVKVGHSRLITPSESLWDDWFEGAGVSDDFMSERAQPENQTREAF